MYIVFDTNIWLSEFGLNSEAGAAVRFYIKSREATVAIPEVVRLEFENNLTDNLKKLRSNIVKDHGKFLKFFGELKDVVLPSDEEICNKVSDIIPSLDIPFIEIPFSFDAAKSSFLKIIKKDPPSKNKQQFKDGVIWAHCLELLNKADVIFVSKDTDFYQDRKYEKGLALNLYEEARKFPNKLKLVEDLSGLLEDIRQEVKIDQTKLLKAIFEKSGEEIHRILEETGFSLGNDPVVEKNLFLTENSTRLYIEFHIIYECLDETEQGRSNATLMLKGSGSYETDKQEFEKIRLSNIRLQYTDNEGQKHNKGPVYLSGHIVLGHQTVKHTIKHSLSD